MQEHNNIFYSADISLPSFNLQNHNNFIFFLNKIFQINEKSDKPNGLVIIKIFL